MTEKSRRAILVPVCEVLEDIYSVEIMTNYGARKAVGRGPGIVAALQLGFSLCKYWLCLRV